MTPPRSVTGVLATSRWLAHPWRRRLILLAAAALFLLLTFYPYRHRGVVLLAPQSSNTAGLASILSQLGGNYAALLGTQQPIEIDLATARSPDVALDVARRLHLLGQDGFEDRATALRTLENKVTIKAMRGSIVEMSARDGDPQVALRLVDAYARATQVRLAEISRAQTAYKRKILNDRMAEARTRLARAEAAVTAYRAQSGLPDPSVQATAAVGVLAGLQSQLAAKEVALAAARRFATDDNMQVKTILTEMATIRQQIADASRQGNSSLGPSAQALGARALQYENLRRELSFSQTLYDAYTRYLEGAAIEELTADFNMQILEEPHLDPDRQVNTLFLALFVLTVGLAIALELYIASPRMTAPRLES